MRKILTALLVAVAVLATAASTGCENSFVGDQARSSAAGFLSGIFSSAVNAALNGSG